MKRFLISAFLFAAVLPAFAQRQYTDGQISAYRNFITAIHSCNLMEIKRGIDADMPLNINSRDEQYDTLLILAVRANCKDGAWILLNAGAKPQPNKYKLVSPLNLVMERYSTTLPGDWDDFVSKLLEANANPNFKNENGETALTIAVKFDRPYYIDRLINESAVRLDSADNYGRTALHWAAYWNYGDIARQLLEGGASYTKKDNEGLTPLALARRMHNTFAAQEIAYYAGAD